MHVLRPNLISRPVAARQLLPRRARRSSILRRGQSAVTAGEVEQRYGWTLEQDKTKADGVKELKVADIIRPLARTRNNDTAKVEALMESVEKKGLKEPIDVLEVDGKIYGFSGCHRYEAFQRLGRETIPCRIRKANQQTLRMHMI